MRATKLTSFHRSSSGESGAITVEKTDEKGAVVGAVGAMGMERLEDMEGGGGVVEGSFFSQFVVR